MNIKILILGANGFLGKNLKNLLKNENYDFYYAERKDIDISDKQQLLNLFMRFSPDVVINCCGTVGSSESNKQKDQFDIFISNLILNTNILDCCKLFKIKKLILFSTYRLFPEDIPKNYNETNLVNTDLAKNNIGYLLSKQIMDQQTKLLKKINNDMNIITLILPNIFGINDTFSINSRIVPAIITKINIANTNNTNVFINSHKYTKVNIIYVNDIVNIINKCIETDNITGNIIIFNKKNIFTLSELSSHIKGLTNFKNEIVFTNDIEPNDNNLMFPNISKFDNFFTDFVFTELNVSLENTINFFNYTKSNLI